ncbi:MAG: hypothetical protein K0R67_1748 [Paenibacillus sp.]|jgi:hypothetical protein|nr:hypothetical protein [Paenibacillus sp.]
MEQFINENWYGSYLEFAIQFRIKLSDDVLTDSSDGKLFEARRKERP